MRQQKGGDLTSIISPPRSFSGRVWHSFNAKKLTQEEVGVVHAQKSGVIGSKDYFISAMNMPLRQTLNQPQKMSLIVKSNWH